MERIGAPGAIWPGDSVDLWERSISEASLTANPQASYLPRYEGPGLYHFEAAQNLSIQLEEVSTY